MLPAGEICLCNGGDKKCGTKIIPQILLTSVLFKYCLFSVTYTRRLLLYGIQKFWLVECPIFSQYGKKFVMSPPGQANLNSWVRLQSSQISGLNVFFSQNKMSGNSNCFTLSPKYKHIYIQTYQQRCGLLLGHKFAPNSKMTRVRDCVY